jgi:hypothetical protein
MSGHVDCGALVRSIPSVFAGAPPIRIYADGCTAYGPYPSNEAVDRGMHVAMNTYETVAAGEGIYIEHDDDDRISQVDVIGANHRRLIVRDTDEGLYVGGCVISNPAVARVLAEVIADWARTQLGERS